jgi:glycosyltransferase involved in cell wall biosynthesis
MDSISVVLCTFNGARFLDAQLRSLLAQSAVDEIVVVDDGSTDETLGILQAYAARDRRFRISINAEQLGVTRNFERGIQLARGQWVALCDQDDVWLPAKLGRMRAAWDGRSLLVHHATRKFRGVPPASVPVPAGQRRKFAGADLRQLLYRNSIVGHTTLVRRDAALALMPFPADVPHDWWIGAGVAAQGNVQYLDEYLVHYRIHDRNAYHRAGSRLQRMRAEHVLRLHLLAALERLPWLTEPARHFVRAYRAEVAAAQCTWIPWRLGRYYWQHAPIFFGHRQGAVSLATRVRKSVAAACGALAQSPAAGGRNLPRAGTEAERCGVAVTSVNGSNSTRLLANPARVSG